jgi:hypothetical protein
VTGEAACRATRRRAEPRSRIECRGATAPRLDPAPRPQQGAPTRRLESGRGALARGVWALEGDPRSIVTHWVSAQILRLGPLPARVVRAHHLQGSGLAAPVEPLSAVKGVRVWVAQVAGDELTPSPGSFRSGSASRRGPPSHLSSRTDVRTRGVGRLLGLPRLRAADRAHSGQAAQGGPPSSKRRAARQDSAAFGR